MSERTSEGPPTPQALAWSDTGAPGADRVGEAGLEAARAKLDLALLALQPVTDGKLPIRRAVASLRRALVACYQAMTFGPQDLRQRPAQVEAVEATRQVLAILQEVPRPEGAILQAMGRVAAALGLLLGAASRGSKLRPPVGLDGEEVPAFAPATIDVPTLLEAPRGFWPAIVPLKAPAVPTVEAAPPPEPEPEPEPAAITSAEALQAFGAEAAARLEAFDGAADEADDDQDEQDRQDEERGADSDGTALPPAEAEAEAVATQIGPPPLPATDVLEARAVLLLEEMANLGNMRRPLGREPWAAPRTEQRLLARLDALAACGDEIAPRLMQELEDRPLPDPALTWALLFYFGSWPGDDATDQVERLALTADLASPDMAVFVTDALSLLPHQGINRALLRWLAAPMPLLRATAVAALGRRRALPPAAAVKALADSDRAVVIAAARAYGHLGPSADRDALAATLSPTSPRTREAAEAAASSELEREVLLSAALLGARFGTDHARRLVASGQGTRGDAALFVALGGDRSDAASLLGQLPSTATAPTGSEGPADRTAPLVAEALGWLGAVEAVPALLRSLDAPHASQAFKEAAAFALFRLTGAALTDDDPAEAQGLSPDPTPWPSTFEPPATPGQLTQKAAIWGVWWERHGQGAAPEARHRYGRLWTVEATLWELGHPATAAAERALLHAELVLKTGLVHLPLDREAFVVTQKTELAAFAEAAARTNVKPGTFASRFVR